MAVANPLWRAPRIHGVSDDRDDHLAIQEHLNGKVVDWMEKVTDEQYAGVATPSR
jgi:hypothetical protein